MSLNPTPAAAADAAAMRTLAVHTTARDTGQRLAADGVRPFAPAVQPREDEVSIVVNTARRFQTLLGIGGAITDASAEVFAKLPAAQQAELLRAYYDARTGLGYTWARTTIHSSDFSSASYTYVDEGDTELRSFSISHDREFRLPLIQRAMAAVAASGGKLDLFASPWSPPAFMKDTGRMVRGGALRPEYQAAWANYYVKFVQAYEAAGVPIWGLSVQNEPMATQSWESSIYTATYERDFLKNHLGPTLQRAGLSSRRVIVWDHNRDLLPHRAHTILSDPEAARYVWGVGYHWYETWTGGDPLYRNVSAVAEAYPQVPLLLTEAAIEKFAPERLQHWPNGERYGSAMINDFAAGAVAWTDWNILLDERGGPNHVGNYCFAPIHADTAKGELIVTPPYWYIGHFSRYIRPGAQRVSASSSRSTLQTVSFVNTDGRLATVVLNVGDEAVDYSLLVNGASGDRSAKVRIPAHAIQTLIY